MRAESLRQLLDQVDRAVLAAGAADGHRDVAAVIAHQRMQPVAYELLNVPEHVTHLVVACQVADHWLILAGQVAQAGLVVRIRQHAHIKHEIGVYRHAALESKRFKHQGQLRGR